MMKRQLNNGLICPVSRPKQVVRRLEKEEENKYTQITPFYGFLPKESLVDYVIRSKTHFIPEEYRFIGTYLIKQVCTPWYIDGRIIMVSCGTGTGKTTFVIELAKNIDGKILFLSNRVANLEQFKLKVKSEGIDNVVIMSYQAMQSKEGKDLQFLNKFSVVVSDEIHYIFSDSRFNGEANVSFIKLMSLISPLKIMLSATTERVMPLIVEEMFRMYSWNQLEVMKRFENYELKNKNSNIRNIVGFSRLEDLIPKIETSEYQWLVFVKSVEQGKEFIQKLKSRRVNFDYLFLHRRALEDLSEDTQQVTLFKSLIQDRRYKVKLLIATCIIDNGVDVCQSSVKNVVIMSNDSVEFIQMIGRKRCQSTEDWFDLYIFEENYRSLTNAIIERKQEMERYRQAEKKLNENMFDRRWIVSGKENDPYRACIFYDYRSRQIRPNYLLPKQLRFQLSELYAMRNSNNPFRYKVSWVLNKIECCPNIIETHLTKKEIFMDLIQQVLNIRVYKKDKELSKSIRLKFGEEYIRVFGKNSKNDRKGRVIGLDRIKVMIELQKLPIVVEEDDASFVFKQI